MSRVTSNSCFKIFLFIIYNYLCYLSKRKKKGNSDKFITENQKLKYSRKQQANNLLLVEIHGEISYIIYV